MTRLSWLMWGFGVAALLGLAACGADEGGADEGAPACRLNSDCPQGFACDEGACVEAVPCEGEACRCAGSGDCGIGEACDLQTGECFELECLRTVDCSLGELCEQGRCLTDVDADRDRDGVPDLEDRCPAVPDADQEDNDGDRRGDISTIPPGVELARSITISITGQTCISLRDAVGLHNRTSPCTSTECIAIWTGNSSRM